MNNIRQLLGQIGDALRKNGVAFDPYRFRGFQPGVATAAPITVREALDAIRQQVENGQLSDMEMILLLNEIGAIVAHTVAEHRRRYPTADVLQHERLDA